MVTHQSGERHKTFSSGSIGTTATSRKAAVDLASSEEKVSRDTFWMWLSTIYTPENERMSPKKVLFQ